MLRKVLLHVRGNVIAYLALFLALGGASAYAANTIYSTDIVNGEVKSADIEDAVLGTPTKGIQLADLAENSVNSVKLKDRSIKNQDFGPNSVDSSKVVDGSVVGDDLADGAVTPAKTGTVPAARVTNSTNETIEDGVFTPLAFDTESFDTAGLHDPSIDNTRVTAPISGLYEVTANVVWAPPGDGSYRGLWLQRNGMCCQASSVGPPSPGTFGTHQSVSDVMRLSAGDYVETMVRQVSGGSVDVAGYDDTHLAMSWLGP